MSGAMREDEPTERDVEALAATACVAVGLSPRWAEQLASVLAVDLTERIAEARRDGAAEVEAKALALADEWYPGIPGPRRMTSWGQLAMEKCARQLRAALRSDA